MMRFIRNIFLAISLVMFCACEEPDSGPIWNDNWNENTKPDNGEETPENPDNQETPTPEKKEEKARLVWIDAAANFKDYANSKKNIADDMARLKETGFTGVVVDIHIYAISSLSFNLSMDILVVFMSWLL